MSEITKSNQYLNAIRSVDKPSINNEFDQLVWARFFTRVESMLGLSPDRTGRKDNRLAIVEAIKDNAKDLTLEQVFKAYKLFSELRLTIQPKDNAWCLNVPDLIQIVRAYRKFYMKKPEVKPMAQIEAPSDPQYYVDKLIKAASEGENVSIVQVMHLTNYIKTLPDFHFEEMNKLELSQRANVLRQVTPNTTTEEIKRTILRNHEYQQALDYIRMSSL